MSRDVVTPKVPSYTRVVTNCLASAWGLASAYVFFQSVLVSHDTRLIWPSVLSFIIVWATLERKRWGRLALVGLGRAVVALFLLAAAGVMSDWLGLTAPKGPSFTAVMCDLLRQLTTSSTGAILVIGIAAATVIWLCSRGAAAEFEHNKKVSLARAQETIAACLVACWAFTLFGGFLGRTVKAPPAPRAAASRFGI